MTRKNLATETGRTWPGKQRRSPRFGVAISVVSLAMLVALALLINRPAPQVTTIATASALDDGYNPSKTTSLESGRPEPSLAGRTEDCILVFRDFLREDVRDWRNQNPVQLVIDYIAGMTDSFFIDSFKELFLPAGTA